MDQDEKARLLRNVTSWQPGESIRGLEYYLDPLLAAVREGKMDRAELDALREKMPRAEPWRGVKFAWPVYGVDDLGYCQAAPAGDAHYVRADAVPRAE